MVTDQLQKITSKKFRVRGLDEVARALKAMPLTERAVFFVLAIVFAASAFALVLNVSKELTVPIPADGGTLTEGIIGIPRFINPLLAISDADRDLTTLVYSGLVRVSSDGTLIHDLAENHTVSDNGLEYTFRLKEDARFHDGTSVTASDVVFTIRKAQDPNLKSPKRASWEGVTAEAVDERTVLIKIKQPYPPFLENTTLGILPAHIWKNVDVEQFTFSQYNIEPIGSGPYRIKNIDRSSGGIPLSYTLVPFKDFTLGEGHISRLVFRFYKSEDDLIDGYERHEIGAINSVSPYRALALKALGARVENVSLPRVFAVFLNQNEAPAFTYAEVRSALSIATDRERIVSEVLSGYGVPLYSPLPENLFGKSSTVISTSTDFATRITEARELLLKNGWVPSPDDGVMQKTVKKEKVRLEFSIATSNSEELKSAAKILKEGWEQIGAKVSLNFFDISDLNQNVIRPRSYDALFFGEIVGRDLDLFAFWHSSQRNDPGLNVALYTNITADKLLESARTATSPEKRQEKYNAFAAEVSKDTPAIFVYSPDFIYVTPRNIQGINLNTVTIPSDRFLHITEWYTETDRVWKALVPTKAQAIVFTP